MGLSLRAYARHRGCSLTAVQKAIAAGRITAESDGTIDPARADRDWKRNTRPGQRRGRQGGVQPRRDGAETERPPETPTAAPGRTRAPDYGEQRAIREAYAARLAKLDYEERTAKLVATDRVKVGWFNILRVLRDRILNLPDRLAAVLAAETDPSEVRNVLAAEFRTVLGEIAESIDGMKGSG